MNEWTQAAETVYTETQAALQLVFDSLNHGQQKKLLKDPQVKALMDHYGVAYDE